MNVKEIGGYFGLESFSGSEYYPCLIKLNSARNALLYLLKARNIRKLHIPRYLCDTVSALCDREGYAYEYYAVDEGFMPVFDAPLAEGEWLYVVNYYGRLSNDTLCALQKKYERLIVDNVQAFFQQPLPGVDTLYSCRKFFGVPDGAYLSTDAALEECLPEDTSRSRMTHILGRFETTGAEFYSDFQENDENFYSLELRTMSPLTQNLLRAIDYEAVRRQRNENYRTLAQALDSCNALPAHIADGPYCYPLYCKNGPQVRKLLAEQKIYIPTLWPNVPKIGNTLECDYTQNILPLPCDQRYTRQDMLRLIKAVKACAELS